MCGRAHLLRGQGEGDAANLGLLGHVEQAETRLEAAVGQAHDAADDQGVGVAALPGAEVDLRNFRRQRSDVAGEQHAKAPAALQIGFDDIADALRQGLFADETQHPDGDLVRAAAGDLDRQLRLCRSASQQEQKQN